jgi:hypothetical protein
MIQYIHKDNFWFFPVLFIITLIYCNYKIYGKYIIMSKWTDHVTKYYKEQRRKNSSYQFRNALKDARKTYSSVKNTMKYPLKRKTLKRKSRRR